MIGAILNAAHGLDNWLRVHLGRPYHGILAIGLVIEIGRRLREFPDIVGSAGGIVKVVIAVVFFAVLLIHQVGELGEHAARRREREAMGDTG
jgi:hypothetical protein